MRAGTPPEAMRPVRRARRLAALSALLVAGCASPGIAPTPDGPARAGGSRVAECRAGDREVPSADACLRDDAACYELASGAYCTGPREGVCPAGSSALATDAPCPPGARCIRAGESLECVIG